MKRYWLILALVLILTVVTSSAALAAPGRWGGRVIHQVAVGENLTSIAVQYGVTVAAIMRENGLTNPDMIYEGQRLVIPVSTPGGNSYNASGCADYHTVKAGETLSGIAWDYDTTLQELLQLNNLQDEDVVYAGEKLCVSAERRYASHPTGQQRYDSSMASFYHTVAKGETLSGIAERYGVRMADIAWANNLGDEDYVQQGQRLVIPGYQPPVAKPAPKPERTSNAGMPARPGPSIGPGSSAGPTSAQKFDQSHKPDQPGQYNQAANANRPSKPDSRSFYLRLGRNVGYEYWGRPKYGLDDCTVDWFDDSSQVKRLTVEVLLTNKSKNIIPGEWASPSNVVFHLASGGYRYACKHRYGYGQDLEQLPSNVTYHPDAGYEYPGDLRADEIVDVTFYTHLEINDLATKIEFTELGICFDPNSGDQVPCGPGY
jgi:LysM repeat protein